MRKMIIVVLSICTLFISSCSTLYNAYIRNFSAETAIVDVFLLGKAHMVTLPNKIRVANRIVNFKGGYKKYIDSMQNVIWVDTAHFKFEMRPNTTADLSDIAGRFVNSSPRWEVKVTVTVKNKTDILINGRHDFRSHVFDYKYRVLSPVLYYDIQ